MNLLAPSRQRDARIRRLIVMRCGLVMPKPASTITISNEDNWKNISGVIVKNDSIKMPFDQLNIRAYSTKNNCDEVIMSDLFSDAASIPGAGARGL